MSFKSNCHNDIVDTCLSSSVSGSTHWARTSITPITCLSQISLTRGVGLPRAIQWTQTVNIWTIDTVKLASLVEESLCTVARYTGTCAWNLLIYTRIMLYTSGNISPGTILLKYEHVSVFSLGNLKCLEYWLPELYIWVQAWKEWQLECPC